MVSQEVNARIRAELTETFAWPSSLEVLKQPLIDLGEVVDLDQLTRLAKRVQIDNNICFTFISIELIKTGMNWVFAMKRLGIDNFIVIAGDEETADILQRQGVAHVVLRRIVDSRNFDGSQIKIASGFSIVALSIVAHKFPIARFLVSLGYNVFFQTRTLFGSRILFRILVTQI